MEAVQYETMSYLKAANIFGVKRETLRDQIRKSAPPSWRVCAIKRPKSFKSLKRQYGESLTCDEYIQRMLEEEEKKKSTKRRGKGKKTTKKTHIEDSGSEINVDDNGDKDRLALRTRGDRLIND
ncbi:hypothetical protein PoB_004076300 [Plakobranchus ocellatus]|uniref:RWP-RK domain-containing protein n=1 Tax=Plakobranchus ocellatus TaxID=259542 RepID=A0AAV4B3V6_9GAST|nr:hypothetical protein PoB_004076300 [Plakobranchus ocellatus]